MNQTFDPSAAGQSNHFAIDVVPGGEQHFIGERRAIKRLKKCGVRVGLPHNTDFIICAQTLGHFLTYGPVGGDNTIYQLLEWAYENAPAFGIHIEQTAGINTPILTLPDKKAANAALAWLAAKVAGA